MEKARLNLIFSLIAQITSILSGLIVPRLILEAFGSEVNGLVASLTQFLGYIALVEGGLGSVVLAALYKPLSEKDSYKINAVLNAANLFFKKIGFAFLIYGIALGIFYPFIVKCSFSEFYVLSLTLILGVGLFIQYCFSITYKLLLQADQRAYFIYILQIITNVISFLSTCIVVYYIPSIHLVKLIPALIYVIQPLVFNWYVKKYYILEKNISADKTALSQRWACFGQNLAFFIHNNTDVAILSIFTDLRIVSVYTVHMMVVNTLKNLIMSISNAYTPLIGQALTKENKEHASNLIDQFEYIMFNFSTLIFGCCLYLLPSFVLLYTNDIHDTNYYQPIFAMLIIFAECIYCLREPYLEVVYTLGRFKETAKGAYLEVGINIVLSLCLAPKLGLIGVALGTVAGMIYRAVFHIIYVKKHIIYRSIRKCIKRVLISIAAVCISTVIIMVLDNTGAGSVLLWIKNAILSVSVYSIVLFGLNFTFDREYTLSMLMSIKRR